MITGLAQERLTKQSRFGVPVEDQDWWPAAPTPSFEMVQGVITDNHAEAISPAKWLELPNGTFHTAKQEFRILYYTPCMGAEPGQPPPPPLEMPLGSRTTKHTKTSPFYWCVE